MQEFVPFGREDISSYDVNCRYAFISDLDRDADTAWLTDLAAAGLRASQVNDRGLVSFEKADPAPIRFYLQPTHSLQLEPPEDQIQLYEDMGWQYIGTYRFHFHVFRCDDPTAPEMHTEAATQTDDYTHSLHQNIRNCCLWLLCAAAVDAGLVFRNLTPFFALNLVRPGSPITGSLLVFIFLYNVAVAAVAVAHIIRIVRLRKALQNGISPTGTGWRRRTLIIRNVLLAALLVGCLTDPLSLFAPDQEFWDGKTPPSEAVYPALDILESSEESHFESCNIHHHPFAPHVYHIEQVSDDTRLFTEYYETRSEKFASRLAFDLVGEEMQNYPNGIFHMDKVETEGLDEFYYEDTELGVQFAVVCRGTQVMRLTYRGTQHLPEHIDWIIESLR